jgi:protein-disulfide isomerase
MTSRLVVLVILTVVAVGAATVLQRRRRPDRPTAPSYEAPTQLDRDDFTRPDAPWLVVVFASETCDSCERVWQAVEPVQAEPVAVQRVVVQRDPGLHKRYRIDGVPTTVVADAEGVVQRSWLGPFPATDLWGELARLREEP